MKKFISAAVLSTLVSTFALANEVLTPEEYEEGILTTAAFALCGQYDEEYKAMSGIMVMGFQEYGYSKAGIMAEVKEAVKELRSEGVDNAETMLPLCEGLAYSE